MTQTVYIGQSGFPIEVQFLEGGLPKNIAGAAPLAINLQKPDGTKLQKAAAFTVAGADGKIRYVAEVGLIDAAGDWLVQGKATLAGVPIYTATGAFTVAHSLDP
jgi:hypothetical protein